MTESGGHPALFPVTGEGAGVGVNVITFVINFVDRYQHNNMLSDDIILLTLTVRVGYH